MAFWGCLLRGVVVVPIDYRASARFLHKVGQLVDARVLLVGDEVEPASRPGLDVWRLAELGQTAGAPARPATPTPAGHTPARDERRGDHLHLGRHDRAQGGRHHPP